MDDRNRMICEEYIGKMLKEYLEQELAEDEFSFLLESDRDELIEEYTGVIFDDWWIHYGNEFVDKARYMALAEMESEEVE